METSEIMDGGLNIRDRVAKGNTLSISVRMDGTVKISRIEQAEEITFSSAEARAVLRMLTYASERKTVGADLGGADHPG